MGFAGGAFVRGGPVELVRCAGYVAFFVSDGYGARGEKNVSWVAGGGGGVGDGEVGEARWYGEGRDLLDDGVFLAACRGNYARVDETDGGKGDGDFDGAAGGFVGVVHEEMFGHGDVALSS